MGETTTWCLLCYRILHCGQCSRLTYKTRYKSQQETLRRTIWYPNSNVDGKGRVQSLPFNPRNELLIVDQEVLANTQVSIDTPWVQNREPHKWSFDDVTPYFRQSILDALQGHIRYNVPAPDIGKVRLKRGTFSGTKGARDRRL